MRAAQLAAYLEGQGHELRIVAGDRLPFPAALTVPPLKAKLFRAGLRNIEAPIDFGRRLLGSNAAGGAALPAGEPSGVLAMLVKIYRASFAIPDAQIGWYPAAIAAADRAVESWTPDVIISSALPFTSHLVAARIARRTRKP